MSTPSKQPVARGLARFASPGWTPPFPEALPSDLDDYLARHTPLTLAWRRARRLLALWAGRQLSRQATVIPAGTRRVLWLYKGTPQVGDSLMDLASRVLLKEAGIAVDLYTDPHLAEMYADDGVFGQVFSEAAELVPARYELVIVHSYSSHCLREKLRLCAGLPFVPFYGYYTGPEFNRTLFSFFRMNQLLQAGLPEDRLRERASPVLYVHPPIARQVDELALPARFVALCIGGVRAWRTYAHWPQVVAILRQQGFTLPLVLLGSANGLDMRDRLLGTAAQPLHDLVDRLSLPETAEVIRRAALTVCADGGLMHVANAVGTPQVILLADFVTPALRLTPANRALTLYHRDEVSALAPELVASQILQAWQRFG